jgi:hypothetical protein
MVILLKDRESKTDDVIFITETTTAKQIQDIIDDSRVTIGDTDNFNWEDVESRLPIDVKCYTDWKCEFETIYW